MSTNEIKRNEFYATFECLIVIKHLFAETISLMIGKITLFSTFLFFSLMCFPQGQGGEQPESWGLNLPYAPDIIHLDPLDFSLIVEEDRINDLDKSQPWRYGIERPLSLNMWDHGIWNRLEDGGKLWRLAIQSPNALNMSINFDDFYLPPGSKLQLYNNDHTDITSTFTSLQNHSGNQLGTWFVEGDTVWLEYYQPPNSNGVSTLHIASIIHGYRLGRVNNALGLERGFNDSGACNYDVNCFIGDDFDSKKDVLKKAVALLNLGNGYLCSATLVNNTKADKTPFLLTANHCLEMSDPRLWSIRFNWVSPNPVCGIGGDSGELNTNFTMSGAEIRANNPLTDFALVELNNPIPGAWDVAFAGWDNSDIEPLFEVGIHHPNGDIMKICRDDSGAQKMNANGTEVWLIGGEQQGWGDGWEIGTTESGSSGSPLFNENGKIIGQLYAGHAACDGMETNGDYDLYGRFGVSWNIGTSSGGRLKDWLDFADTGQTTMETLQNILNVPDFELTGELKIYPNPASTSITVMNSRYPHLSYEFSNLIGQRLHAGSLSNTTNTISLEDLSEGVYMLRLTDEESQDFITKKIIVKR